MRAFKRACVLSGAAAATVALSWGPVLAAPTTGPGSLAGYWVSVSSLDLKGGRSGWTVGGVAVPLLSEAAKTAGERLAGHDGGKPFQTNAERCVTEGMPSAASPPPAYPFEIVETPKQVTTLMQSFRIFRTAHIGAQHGQDPDPTFMGDAVANWEGGALVIDTIAITDSTNVLGVIPHSDKLHVVERLRRTGPEALEDRITIEDPTTFSKPFTLVARFKRAKVQNLADFICEPKR